MITARPVAGIEPCKQALAGVGASGNIRLGLEARLPLVGHEELLIGQSSRSRDAIAGFAPRF